MDWEVLCVSLMCISDDFCPLRGSISTNEAMSNMMEDWKRGRPLGAVLSLLA